ncbi:NUDIX domain-containing protein [Cellulomonas timonensis]|uniref:NUDIX domain-containing protein n=1 Tax=Cellulomonas timonensis TaxID=1689271 RepID=UPI001F232C38|nr:NUDIX domain-containing protein [Cellulomonas timonensis]
MQHTDLNEPILVENVRAELSGWPPPDPRQERLRVDYLAHLESHGTAALWKSGPPEHLTASCVVLSDDLAETLLCFHRKGKFWVQFGGHLEESDASLAAAAAREAREESQVPTLQLLDAAPFDLDRHALSGGWTCAEHLDVGFVAVLPRTAAFAVSDESEALAWWPVSALPTDAAEGLADRIARARRHAAQLLDGQAPDAQAPHQGQAAR